jgi:serine/threonine protein kinase
MTTANYYTSTSTLQAYEIVDQVKYPDPIQLEYAFQPFLERDVVIRRLIPQAARNPRLRHNFIQEIRTLAMLHHPNIAQVYDAGMHDDQPYMVVEQLQGITLQQRLEQLQGQRAHMDLEEVAQIMDGVASLVAYAHRRGVRVYNLMPTNIVLTSDRQGVLMALGSAPPADVSGLQPQALTFLAPEYFTGDVVDSRSDIYSLGVLLYLLLTGRAPFEGSANQVISQKQSMQGFPALVDPFAEPPFPYAVAHLLRQATARKLDQRYATAQQFRQALAAALNPQPIQLPIMRRLPPAQRRRMLVAGARRALSTPAVQVEAARELGSSVITVEAEPLRPRGVVIDIDAVATTKATPALKPVVVPTEASQPLAARLAPTPATTQEEASELPKEDAAHLLADRAEWSASLPFTVLVPTEVSSTPVTPSRPSAHALAQPAAAEPATSHAPAPAQPTLAAGEGGSARIYMLLLLLAVLVSVAAAMMLG